MTVDSTVFIPLPRSSRLSMLELDLVLSNLWFSSSAFVFVMKINHVKTDK